MRASCPECRSMRIAWKPLDDEGYLREITCQRCDHEWEVDLRDLAEQLFEEDDS